MDSRQTSREWFDRARHDWDAANFILDMRPVPVEIVCYHCQQAVEKTLKGYLVAQGMEPVPRIHDLTQLCLMCQEKDARFANVMQACGYLTVFATQTRSPSSIDPSEVEMNRALDYTKDALAFIQQLTQEPEQEEGPTMTM